MSFQELLAAVTIMATLLQCLKQLNRLIAMTNVVGRVLFLQLSGQEELALAVLRERLPAVCYDHK